ncbi:unnamed protein product (macronuclear) [Paramecium tetraurelia]|uniref:Uncharacterized protein n=1 Tax=Paramecium tetraurelia TaxID=5888 RepID=A0BZ43_PARTE|nr:uncharacterized protein GSPATT00033663001 [Paramecium tetraurelia]CAK63810.1 unnamed protein product [Paramecium tetraurelia]|eukprot:XP_001431208.1 hypothetical protein (macronuclear) [Paramecium tetraurelia strain d4-2]
MRQQSPNSKLSRENSAYQNDSVTVSHIENQKLRKSKLSQRKIIQIKKDDKKRNLENQYKKQYIEYESQQMIDKKNWEGLKNLIRKNNKQYISTSIKNELQEKQITSRSLIEEITKIEKDKVPKLQQISDLQEKITQKKRNKYVDKEIDDYTMKQIEGEIIEFQKKKDEQMKTYGEKYKILEKNHKMKLKKKEFDDQIRKDVKINSSFIHEANRFLRLKDKHSLRSTKPIFSHQENLLHSLRTLNLQNQKQDIQEKILLKIRLKQSIRSNLRKQPQINKFLNKIKNNQEQKNQRQST